MTSAVLSSGAAMDRRVAVPRRYGRLALGAVAAMAMLVLLVRWWPRGVAVARGDVEIAPARAGVFHDVVVGRALVQPLQSVLLDASEDGRVEQVLVKDGAQVEAGRLLVVLSSTQRAGADGALQRGGAAAGQLRPCAPRGCRPGGAAPHSLTEGEFELQRVRRLHQRNRELAATGFCRPRRWRTRPTA